MAPPLNVHLSLQPVAMRPRDCAARGRSMAALDRMGAVFRKSPTPVMKLSESRTDLNSRNTRTPQVILMDGHSELGRAYRRWTRRAPLQTSTDFLDPVWTRETHAKANPQGRRHIFKGYAVHESDQWERHLCAKCPVQGVGEFLSARFALDARRGQQVRPTGQLPLRNAFGNLIP